MLLISLEVLFIFIALEAIEIGKSEGADIVSYIACMVLFTVWHIYGEKILHRVTKGKRITRFEKCFL